MHDIKTSIPALRRATCLAQNSGDLVGCLAPQRNPRHRGWRWKVRRVFGDESWMQTLSNQQNIGDMFLAYIKEASPELGGKWGAEWSEVPENYAAAQEIFAHFATYLVNVYVYGSLSKHLEIPSALAIWSGLLQQNKKRFGKCSLFGDGLSRATLARAR